MESPFLRPDPFPFAVPFISGFGLLPFTSFAKKECFSKSISYLYTTCTTYSKRRHPFSQEGQKVNRGKSRVVGGASSSSSDIWVKAGWDRFGERKRKPVLVGEEQQQVKLFRSTFFEPKLLLLLLQVIERRRGGLKKKKKCLFFSSSLKTFSVFHEILLSNLATIQSCKFFPPAKSELRKNENDREE